MQVGKHAMIESLPACGKTTTMTDGPLSGDFAARPDRPVVLRVVRCLPSRAELPRRDRAHRAGVVQASREETAECTSVAEASLQGYGELKG